MVILALAWSLNAYAQEECKDPNIRATFKERFKEIGTTDPWFLNYATVILHKSLPHRIQLVGLYWEGPILGALLAYDCQGKLLSIQKTGGIKSIQFFYIPRTITPAVAVGGVVDSFEIDPSGPPDQGWKKLTVEGVRKVYPASKAGFSDYRLEKLPTESYCWSAEKNIYDVCK